MNVNVFELDDRLRTDTVHIADIGLCQLRLMNDRRWRWLILVPQRPGISEPFELAPLDQALLTFETNLVASALRKVAEADKINIAAIGNVVRQLHVHIVARYEGDANWPRPVWGFGTPEPYDESEAVAFAKVILDSI